MKTNKLYITFLSTVIFLITSITSCESRKDIFEVKNPKPVFYISETEDDFSAECTEIDTTITFTKGVEFYYQITDDFFNGDTIIGYSVTNVSTHYPASLQLVNCKIDTKNHKIIITDTNEKTIFEHLPNDTIKEIVKIYVKDIYQAESEVIININIINNRGPIAKVESKHVQDWEYQISAEGTISPLGNKIVAYEYLFDGIIDVDREQYEEPGMVFPSVAGGCAAHGGTYIKEITLDKVMHAFQESGEHDIYIRAKDDMDMWGHWTKKTVYIQ